ncbi:MAG: hypothetical protein NOU37_08785 [Candidatus Brocadiales bacterium]|nr:hypothetical protein [Candidatus Bathyanammoxibius amoris]
MSKKTKMYDKIQKSLLDYVKTLKLPVEMENFHAMDYIKQDLKETIPFKMFMVVLYDTILSEQVTDDTPLINNDLSIENRGYDRVIGVNENVLKKYNLTFDGARLK